MLNLLALILILFAVVIGLCVFYVAWELSSGDLRPKKEEPGESKESEDSPGP